LLSYASPASALRVGGVIGATLRYRFMNYQDLLTIVLFLAMVLYFSDGGPGTPKRIRIPIPSHNWPQ
jgi:hypothetical protein